jgi:hypothetical protein
LFPGIYHEGALSGALRDWCRGEILANSERDVVESWSSLAVVAFCMIRKNDMWNHAARDSVRIVRTKVDVHGGS